MLARTTSAQIPGDVSRQGSAVLARTRGLTVRIDGRTILHSIDLEVPSGSIVGLVGGNGVGKSTLLKAVARLVTPSRGEVELFGKRLGRWDSARPEIRRRIGVIGHGLMLYRDLTIRENLLLFGRLYDVGDLEQSVAESLDAMAVRDFADSPVKNLSRGTAQRATIARALLHGPDLLLADEPFTGLDGVGCERLEAALRALRGRGGAVVMANHDVEHALGLSDRIMVLNRGRLALEQPTSAVNAEDVQAAMRGDDA